MLVDGVSLGIVEIGMQKTGLTGFVFYGDLLFVLEFDRMEPQPIGDLLFL